MARTTTNYRFNISEGTDLVNPLTDIFPNFEDIDTDLKAVSDSAVGMATEITTGTVHAITRSDSDRDIFVFIATSNWTAGDTITVDGTQVSILTPDGQALATGAYIIGSAVLCVLNGTLITAIVNAAKAKDSDKLDGEDSTYYATAGDLANIDSIVSGLSTKVGSAVLTTTAQDCSGAINELNNGLTDRVTTGVLKFSSAVDISSYTGTQYTAPSDGYATCTGSATSDAIIYIRSSDTSVSTPMIISAPINGANSCFVRKGMRLSVQSGRVGQSCAFVPLDY